MSIAIGEDHLALLDTARRFTAERCPPAVARAAMDATVEALPPFWGELARLGWLGLAVPETGGGEGYGVAELAIVLESLGRAVAPGPVLPTVWAAALVGGDLRADLAGGRRVGAVALDGTVVGRTVEGSTVEGSTVEGGGEGGGEGNGGAALRLSGGVGPVLCGGIADAVVVPVMLGGAERWAVVERAAATVTPLDALDPTRGLARIDLADAPATLLAGLTRDRVEAAGVTLAAAECAGGAAWCVDTAAAHARDRRQFGRPIGQFQAVKHRCADMLVQLEQARAVAWDAAAALDGDDPSGAGAALAVAAAGAIAFEAFATVAKDCIQVLGGIGFTWEHDAHLYLRRALALRQLFGGPARWRTAAARAALDGARRHLGVALPPEAEALRAEVRATVEAVAALPPDRRRARLADSGLLVPHWAPPWGRDAGAVEQVVIDQELRRARVRVPHLQVGAWAAPTIAVHGTPEQQERWVRPTLHGEIAWCQLFSEPEAGSDLASLTTRATRVDGAWRLDGRKVWTTMAAEADWGICLARTNPTAPKHLGITYFVVDMRSPGIDVRPLREITGLAMFNEVLLDGVVVPDDCVIGPVDGGWPLARTTLANERVSMGSGSSFGGGIEALVGLVAGRVAAGDLAADARLLDALGALVAEAHAAAAIGLRATARSLSGAAPGAEASVRKLLGVEHDQRTQELGLLLLGPEGATTAGAAGQWTYGFLANRCLTIAGGTSEIQRNVIGERLLGLPRDPEPGPSG
ncbi:MAG TPA: acyl-CoA dehydrogenase [Acidimicrobiales bacterium]|nr:acyl-CoA dehydrogenase [Acidimicrobiales bacterium]